MFADRFSYQDCYKQSYRLLPIIAFSNGITTANGRYLLSRRLGFGSIQQVEHFQIHWRHH